MSIVIKDQTAKKKKKGFLKRCVSAESSPKNYSTNLASSFLWIIFSQPNRTTTNTEKIVTKTNLNDEKKPKIETEIKFLNSRSKIWHEQKPSVKPRITRKIASLLSEKEEKKKNLAPMVKLRDRLFFFLFRYREKKACEKEGKKWKIWPKWQREISQ